MLDKGMRVFGVSRTIPQDLLRNSNFHHVQVDLSDSKAASERLADYFIRQQQLDRVAYLFLNAGVFGSQVQKVSDISLPDIKNVVDINLWTNKVVLDVFFRSGVPIETCCVSASVAGVRARAGMGSYAISKAALNMMMRLYALENPSTFFAVLGLCSLKTGLFERILYPPVSEGEFPDVALLQQRAHVDGYLVSPQQRAGDIFTVLNGPLRQHLISGEFTDMRGLLSHGIN
jgi:NAD(P)-dependent dehydrogenase (short-subunit alcohol dehydrogenase family)